MSIIGCSATIKVLRATIAEPDMFQEAKLLTTQKMKERTYFLLLNRACVTCRAAKLLSYRKKMQEKFCLEKKKANSSARSIMAQAFKLKIQY